MIEDLHRRGLNKKVLLLLTGEFSRTSRVENNDPGRFGRDHYPAADNSLSVAFGLSSIRLDSDELEGKRGYRASVSHHFEHSAEADMREATLTALKEQLDAKLKPRKHEVSRHRKSKSGRSVLDKHHVPYHGETTSPRSCHDR